MLCSRARAREEVLATGIGGHYSVLSFQGVGKNDNLQELGGTDSSSAHLLLKGSSRVRSLGFVNHDCLFRRKVSGGGIGGVSEWDGHKSRLQQCCFYLSTASLLPLENAFILINLIQRTCRFIIPKKSFH